MRRGPGRLAAVVVVALLVSGCSVGPIRRAAPTRAPVESSPAAVTQSGRPPLPADETRRSQVPVPAGHQQHQVEFTDAEHGYTMYTDCQVEAPDEDCEAILFSTADGGRSWQPLPHPRPMARNHQLYSAGNDVVLLAEPHGWFASTNRGSTFAAAPVAGDGVPVAYRKLFGRFQVCCDEYGPQVGEWVGERFFPLQIQPMVPGLREATHTGGRLYAAGLRDGQPYAALSFDQGKSWRQMTVPASDVAVSVLRLEIAAVDGGAWLIGYPEDRFAFPQLWRISGGTGWERVRVTGQPDRVGALAAISSTMLAVAGPMGGGLISEGRYHDLGWPLGNSVQALPDGTLTSGHQPDDSVWLGVGKYDERRWIKVVLERVQ